MSWALDCRFNYQLFCFGVAGTRLHYQAAKTGTSQKGKKNFATGKVTVGLVESSSSHHQVCMQEHDEVSKTKHH